MVAAKLRAPFTICHIIVVHCHIVSSYYLLQLRYIIQSYSPGNLLNTSAECYHTISLTVNQVSDVLSAPTFPIICTKREHGVVSSGSWTQRIPIPERDHVPLRPFRHHPRPTHHTLLFKPHALSHRERWLVRSMCRPLHPPKAEPARAPRWRVGQLEGEVQEEADGIVGHVGASEFGEDDYPSDLHTQIHGKSAEQRDHARERVTTRLVDDGEKDGHGIATYESFDLGKNIVEG
jgi:hypothetical protein